MAWLRGLLGREPGAEHPRVLHLKVTRFAQMLRHYGTLVDLIADAAEKQGGEFILDRQYVISVTERALDLAESVLFDAGVLAPQSSSAFFAALEHHRAALRGLLAAPAAPIDGASERRSSGEPRQSKEHVVAPEVLAQALSHAPVALRGRGQVACRGLAAGSVFNLSNEPDPRALPAGAVLVGQDLDSDGDALTVMARASAILLDHGTPGGAAASLARELRIPTLVGLGDASTVLANGTTVTVDADESVVYFGRVQPLFDYYAAEKLGADEEVEYSLLRGIRRAAFPLAPTDDQSAPAGPDSCLSLHDLVHLAHCLAGESVFAALVQTAGTMRVAKTRLAPGIDCQVIDLGGDPPAMAPTTAPAGALRTFFDGVGCDGCRQLSVADPTGRARVAVAVIDDEKLLAGLSTSGGFDLVDVVAGDARAANHLYCRFAPRSGAGDTMRARGAVAAGVLHRLGFATANTGCDVSGWLARRPRPEIEERLQIAGRLCGFLDSLCDQGPPPVTVAVGRFLREFA